MELMRQTYKTKEKLKPRFCVTLATFQGLSGCMWLVIVVTYQDSTARDQQVAAGGHFAVSGDRKGLRAQGEAGVLFGKKHSKM